MSVGILNGVSGFQASVERLETSANNIANANPVAPQLARNSVDNDSVRPQVVQPVAQPEQDIAPVVAESNPAFVLDINPSPNPLPNPIDFALDTPLVNEPANSVVAEPQGFAQAPNVDIAENLVNQIVASNSAVANLRSIEVSDDLLAETIDAFSDTPGSRLDIFA